MPPPLSDPVPILLRVTEALDEVGIPYLVGGSLASIIHGLVRTTADLDLLIWIQPEQVPPLVHLLSAEFLIDEAPLLDAIQHRSSVQLLHHDSLFRVDLFVSKERPFDQARLARRQSLAVARHPRREAWVTSAEDIVLAKLEWFERGGRVSERQWRDVLGVIKIQAGALDVAYLRRWAAALGVAELLELALAEGRREE